MSENPNRSMRKEVQKTPERICAENIGGQTPLQDTGISSKPCNEKQN